MNKQKWFRGLQVLRGILFLLVFVSHSGAWYDTKCFGGGMCGVSGFFVLSGFLSGYFYNPALIQGGLIKSGVIYCWKKLKAFYPLYLCFLLISVPLLHHEPQNNMMNFLKSLCLSQSFWGESKMALCFNWPSWFLSSICLAYLLSPFLNMICWKVRRYSWIGMIAIFFGLVFWGTFWKHDASAYSAGYYYMYICPWIRLFDYIEGILLSYLFRQVMKESNPIVQDGTSIMECVLFLVSIFALRIPAFVPEVYRWSVMWLPISLGLIWCFASVRGNITSWLSKQDSLLWLGARSFELYIAHRMILLFFARSKVGVAYFLAILTILIIVECAYSGKRIIAMKWNGHKEIQCCEGKNNE